MNSFLYISQDHISLAKRWLLAQSQSSYVTLVLDKKDVHLAEDLKRQHDSISGIHIMDTDEAECPGTQKAVLPFAADKRPLRFIKGTTIPDIRPLYTTVCDLWRIGFREFEILNDEDILGLSVPHLLDEFVDIHKGERCFVVGNGPSLNKIDMSKLRNEITFGSNRCYLGYEKWGFEFNYWGIEDRLQIEGYGREYEKRVPRGAVKFFPFEYLPLLKFENACPLNHYYNFKGFPRFSNIPDEIFLGYTVTYMLLQLAAIMGCDPIILVGADHNYSIKERERGASIVPNADCLEVPVAAGIKANTLASYRQDDLWHEGYTSQPTHFDNGYTKGRKWFVPPRPAKAEEAFTCAKRWAKLNGRDILNATPDTALAIFRLVEFESLFQSTWQNMKNRNNEILDGQVR